LNVTDENRKIRQVSFICNKAKTRTINYQN